MDIQTHPALRRAIEFLSSQCDGARSHDDRGFSKTDAAYGHRMAVEMQFRELDGFEQIVIRDIALKYTKTQLERVGIDLPTAGQLREYLGPEWATVEADTGTRSQVLKRLRQAEEDRKPKPPEVTILANADGDRLYARIEGRQKRFGEILSAIKSLPYADRFFAGAMQAWAIRPEAAARLAEALGDFRVEWTAAAAERRDNAPPPPPVAPEIDENATEPEVTITLVDGRVHVSFAGCPRDRMLNHIASVKSIPGARFVNHPVKHWELPAAKAPDVASAFPEARGAEEIRAQIRAQVEGQAEAEAARLEMLAKLNASLDARIAAPVVGHKLREFQIEGIRFVFSCIGRDGMRGALVGDDMGLGKTLTGLVIADELRKQTGATIFALTKASCLDNWAIESARADIPTEIFSHDFRRIPAPLEDAKYAVLIDECFPGDTQVETDSGPMSIAEIVNGRLPLSVWSFDNDRQRLELKPVTRYVKKHLVGDLFRVHHECGSFTATGNHRIWTEEHGYREVRALDGGETLRVLEVPESLSYPNEGDDDGALLQPFVREISGLVSECFRADAATESHERPCGARSHAGGTHGEDLPGSRWEREGFKAAVGSFGAYWSASRSEHIDRTGQGPVRVPARSIQGRSRPSTDTDRNRDRRKVPSDTEVEVSGSAQDRSLGSSRVVRVEILERRGRYGPGDGGKEDPVVYNLEVDGHHNYIANGVLVSNCHAFKNPTAKKTAALLKLVEHPNCIAAIPMSGTLNENGRAIEFLVPLRTINHEIVRDERAFKRRYCNSRTTSIKHRRGRRIDYTRTDAAGLAHLAELYRRIKPVLLRRLKSDPKIGLELPSKTRIFQAWNPSPEIKAACLEEFRRRCEHYKQRVAESETRRAQAAAIRATIDAEVESGPFSVEEWLAWASTAAAPDNAGGTVLEAAIDGNLVGDDTLFRIPDNSPARLADAEWYPDVEIEQWAAGTVKELLDGTISREGEALVEITHMRHAASRAKISTAIDIVDELLGQGRRPVVFFDFADTANEFAEHYGVPCLTGEMAAEGRDGELGPRQKMCEDFNEGRLPVFVGTIKAGGEGLNLTGGSDCILVDRAWTPGKAVQAEDRIWRIGQTRNVFSIWVQAFGIDKVVDDCILKKQEIIERMYTGRARTLEGVEMSASSVLSAVLDEMGGQRPAAAQVLTGQANEAAPETAVAADTLPAAIGERSADGLPEVQVAAAAIDAEGAAPDPAGPAEPVGAPYRAAEPYTGSQGIDIDGFGGPIESGFAAALTMPKLEAPGGWQAYEGFTVREQLCHRSGTLVLLGSDAIDGDRLALLVARVKGPGVCEIITLMVADSQWRRHVFTTDGTRLGLPEPHQAATVGEAGFAAEYAAVIDAVIPHLGAIYEGAPQIANLLSWQREMVQPGATQPQSEVSASAPKELTIGM